MFGRMQSTAHPVTPKDRRIGIVSYSNHFRTLAHVNHQYYANQHGYYYLFDVAPTLYGKYFNKVEKLLKLLDLFEWIFWIDDDAFFLQYDTPLEKFLDSNQQHDLIFCRSPINPEGGWTYLSSGNFFLHNTPPVREFLEACLTTSLATAEKHWDSSTNGLFTHGDQDIMVHLLRHDERFKNPEFHVCLPYEQFNTRPYHFQKKPAEYFLVHFTGDEKGKQALRFAERFKLSPALIPQKDFARFKGTYEDEVRY